VQRRKCIRPFKSLVLQRLCSTVYLKNKIFLFIFFFNNFKSYSIFIVCDIWILRGRLLDGYTTRKHDRTTLSYDCQCWISIYVFGYVQTRSVEENNRHWYARVFAFDEARECQTSPVVRPSRSCAWRTSLLLRMSSYVQPFSGFSSFADNTVSWTLRHTELTFTQHTNSSKNVVLVLLSNARARFPAVSTTRFSTFLGRAAYGNRVCLPQSYTHAVPATDSVLSPTTSRYEERNNRVTTANLAYEETGRRRRRRFVYIFVS